MVNWRDHACPAKRICLEIPNAGPAAARADNQDVQHDIADGSGNKRQEQRLLGLTHAVNILGMAASSSIADIQPTRLLSRTSDNQQRDSKQIRNRSAGAMAHPAF